MFDLDAMYADEAQEDGTAAATVSVWTLVDGEYATLLRRETVELDEDTDEAAQILADATAAGEPPSSVTIRVLVGRDSTPHAYRAAERAAVAA